MRRVGLLACGMALLFDVGCVDWEALTTPLPDAGTGDAGTDPDAGSGDCSGTPPDEPMEPLDRCGSVTPLPDSHWQRLTWDPTDPAPTLGRRADQLVVVDDTQVHFFCGGIEVEGPVGCDRSPRGPMDAAPDGTVVVGAAGGACIIDEAGCGCISEDVEAEQSGVAVVTPATFVLVVHGGVSTPPVLEERSLTSPFERVGALQLTAVDDDEGPVVITRLPRPCAHPTTWAVTLYFPTTYRLFLAQRPYTTGGLTVTELDPHEHGEALGVVAASVGATPGTSTTLMVARSSQLGQLELKRGTLAAGGETTLGAWQGGGSTGYGDYLSGACAARPDGRLACLGSQGLLATNLRDDADYLVTLPTEVARRGDTTGTASFGDDAWIFGSNFAAHTSLSVPQWPAGVLTDVVANTNAGERVVGAPMDEDHLLVGSPWGSAVVSFPPDGTSDVAEVPMMIDALALGASSGVAAWVARDGAQVHAIAVDTGGYLYGEVASVSTAIDPEFAVADRQAPTGVVSLWLGGLDRYAPPAARLVLQRCAADAPGANASVSCESTVTADLVLHDPASAGALHLSGDRIFFAGSGAVAAVQLNATRNAIVGMETVAVPLVNNLDPQGGGVRSMAITNGCLYVAAGGRIVQPIELALGAVPPFLPKPPLLRQLDVRALLTLGDDSVLFGAEHGRTGRFHHVGDSACATDADGETFDRSFGPSIPAGALRSTPVFVGDDLYLADEDGRIWRVPLP